MLTLKTPLILVRCLAQAHDSYTPLPTHTSTHNLGYTTVPRQQKQQLVGQVFSSVASSYDVMNDLMSAGLHRLWKDHLVTTLAPGPGQQHLDVAGGTGDVAFRVLRAIRLAEASGVGGGTGGRMRGGPGGMMEHAGQHAGQRKRGSVTVFDINADMLAEGQRRAAAQGLDRQEGDLVWVEGNAECLPFEEGCVDSYTVAFGIRNVTNRDAALKEAFRVRCKFLFCVCLFACWLVDCCHLYTAFAHNTCAPPCTGTKARGALFVFGIFTCDITRATAGV